MVSCEEFFKAHLSFSPARDPSLRLKSGSAPDDAALMSTQKPHFPQTNLAGSGGWRRSETSIGSVI